MKKILLSLLLITLFFNKVFSQYDTLYVNGVPKISKKIDVYGEGPSPLEKDDYLIEISYGLPFVPIREAAFFGIDYFSNTRNSKEIKNTNHLCAKADYQLSKDFSVGLELTYATNQFEYYRTYTTYDTLLKHNVTTDTLFKARATKIRLLAEMSYHLNISERFDAYGTAGFGYKQFAYTAGDSYLNSNHFSTTILPLAIRISVGGRFFVSKDLAIHIEGGLGGPLMQFGLSYKLHSYAYSK